LRTATNFCNFTSAISQPHFVFSFPPLSPHISHRTYL
jgi:hypothetical protein